MASSDELMLRAVQGDNAALEALLRDAAPQVRCRVESRIPKKWQALLDAEDILQVTYLEAFLRIRDFIPKGEGAFLPWLARIADNNLLDAIRALQRAKRPPAERRVRPADVASVVLYEEVMRTNSTASRQLVRKEAHEALETALNNLPADYARVVKRYDLDGISVGALAKELKRSEGAVYMLRARAMDRLRELLSAHASITKGSA
jgi:RNA polymerase sigma factor (sigma-70 family)